MNQLVTYEAMSVVGPLNEGIFSVYNICRCLLDVKVDTTTDKCSNYQEIRRHIEHAEQSLKKSETMINEKLKNLDECMCQYLREKTNLENLKTEKNMAVFKLELDKKYMEDLLKNTNNALEQATKKLESAKYASRIEEERLETNGKVFAAGAALLVLPIAGWIAGPIMMATADQAWKESLDAIQAAEEEIQKCKENANRYTRQKFDYKINILNTEAEIIRTNTALIKIENKIKDVKKYLKETTDIQEKVRGAVMSLSVLSGRVTVLERQTQCFILWQPVVQAMEDVVRAVGNITENWLLYRHGAPFYINALREDVRRLALCNSPNESKYDWQIESEYI
ncbi:uncharacterized protein LOC122360109 [Puntigrus tetrazona]|uniref:uncharacterized protein LOC122360109 n=1 Tax=Puntigrus tetrazona TaxID=1606681 RepID=UPI001C893093|nr:uncharacterized protein LOC122360109 [Puntigrus tetrazona]